MLHAVGQTGRRKRRDGTPETGDKEVSKSETFTRKGRVVDRSIFGAREELGSPDLVKIVETEGKLSNSLIYRE